MAAEEVIYHDLSKPQDVIAAMNPEERVNHQIEVLLAGRFAAGSVIAKFTEEEREAFAAKHPVEYDDLVLRVTSDLLKQDIIPCLYVHGQTPQKEPYEPAPSSDRTDITTA